MIDKIRISTKDYRFSEKANPQIIPFAYYAQEPDAIEGYIFDIGGKSFYGKKAIWNNDIVNITINPNLGFEAHFNPAVVMHQNNYYPIKEGEFQESLDIISKTIKDAGFYLDFESANISRLDIAQDRQMKEPFAVYNQLFRLLKAKRANPAEYSTGFYLRNGSREIVFYDKLEQMKDAGKEIPSGASNVMRCEYKLKNKDSVCRFAGIKDIASMRKITFSELSQFYRNSISEFAFSDIPDSKGFAYSHLTETEIMKEFKSAFARNALARYTEARCNVLQRFGSIEAYEKSLLDAGFHRSYVSRHIKKVLQSLAIIEKVESELGIQSIGRLYAEVREKFVAQAA